MGEGTSALLRIKLAWQGHWDVGRSCAGLAWDGGGCGAGQLDGLGVDGGQLMASEWDYN